MARRRVTGGSLLLDSEGLSKLADKDARVLTHIKNAMLRRALVATSAITLAEVLRGGRRDAKVHHALSRIVTLPVTDALGRAAGELLGATGLSGHRCAIDSVVAATALSLPRPGIVLTSDVNDLGRLVEEPARDRAERVSVVLV